ncbi:MAG: class I SAM-dependent methyltransferase [Opitutaceae bacterium]|nr:class I SAM-dependent methyltransferase [Opitutaceae bacterium]
MGNWKLKSAVHRTLSWLPHSHRWNALLQRHVTRGYFASAATFEAKLGCCRRHLSHLRRFGGRPAGGFAALELGTGSWPIVPIGLFLCGADRIWSYDLVPVLEPATLRHTLGQFAAAIHAGSLPRLLPELQPDRLAQLTAVIARAGPETPAEVLSHLNIHVRIGDARHTDLPAGAVPLVFSTVVFEHIPRTVLAGLLTEFRRVLTPDGVMSHQIGLADQFASFDRSITPYNFLRYTERQWRWLNSPMIPQTRLRLADHRALYRENGFDVVHEENVTGSAADLRSVPLAPQFRTHAFDDLLALYSWLVGRPSAPPHAQGRATSRTGEPSTTTAPA